MKKTIRNQSVRLGIAFSFILLAGCSALNPQATPTSEPFPLEDIRPIVSATGKVVPDEWSNLSFTTPGVVQEVLVKKGDLVQENDVLVRLKGREELQAAISAAELELMMAQRDHEDLLKHTDDARIANLDLISRATKAVRDAQYQWDNFTVPSNQAKLSTAEALELMQQRLDQARANFEPYKYYPSTDSTREDLKEALDDAQADYNSAVKRLQYETEQDVAQQRLAEALKDFAILQKGPDPKDVRVAEARLANAKAALAAAQASFDDLELTAPFSGTISGIDVRIGEWTMSGQPVVLLANLDNLQIETTDLNEIDAARVQPGDSVKITFDALPGVEVAGTVKSLAPKSSEGSGVNYTAVIVMDEIPPLLRWGMTAFIDVLVD